MLSRQIQPKIYTPPSLAALQLAGCLHGKQKTPSSKDEGVILKTFSIKRLLR